ncbi:energy transducer TonB [Tunturibacter empetritectus]|uniref:TonB family protein n=1 Tax=Tunturiibacter lichenicola TaxID=2051959 RepID=A0A7W8N4U5_9BACT|nr:energy transducer TonB [Edaphobacter lichenicola]MBB5344883.1 TonB family protein [Edaphobacter lichenicola]
MEIRRVIQTFALCLILVSAARADDHAPLTERLHQAEASSSLDTAGIRQWHLKLDVQLLGEQGKQTEQGTIEEWWTTPTSFQVAYTFPSYTATEIRSEKGLSRTQSSSSPPSLLKLLLNQVVHPMPSAEEMEDSSPDLRRQNFGKVALDCIMLDQKIKNIAYPPLGLFPTYCFDPSKISLRLSYDFGSQVIFRNAIGAFQNRNVATEINVKESNQVKATARVSTLESNASMVAPTIDPTTLTPVDKSATGVAPGVMAGHKLAGANPTYPESARRNRISGTVTFAATIGTDGHIHSLRIVSTPDPDLAISALAAVRTWTYTPYLLNGEPVEVKTQIRVNFNIG